MATKGITFAATIRLVVQADNEYDLDSYANAIEAAVVFVSTRSTSLVLDGLEDIEVKAGA